MIDVSEYFVAAFILIGAFFGVVTAIGLIRLPDLYTRTHAASKSATLGVMSVLIGALLFFLTEEGMFNSRIVLGIFFVLITAPVGGHLIARAAYNSGVKLAPETVHDDLSKKEQYEKKKNSSRD
ncbi:monovalent cation/H(+) antiporter subunit G [Jeotgalibacillus haloalkalitolerans]|uniref:Monovalent cation/H(+) antiporter subunit G n=1 Tax=Jeotgalibacillus haloalkalitolerans TaxID=3104292 RepID=A0ABU5KR28_9BACL|nr:monovalent cation/H(+) antiporter subunit G [Jeotgalibacillus sp. HH7-29]MDZ5713635.1 monovalent cation/H(+) antiporter subunit G [Jeotgalibacillus sp. HH7-29]